MIFLPDESKRTVLPHGIQRVHLNSQPRIPCSLIELGLRNLYTAPEYYKQICSILPDGVLPHDIYQSLINGPPSLCGNQMCRAPLFTECHFLLLKK